MPIIFAVGSIGFYILLAVAILLIILATKEEELGFATLILFIFAICISIAGDVNIFKTAWENIQLFVMLFICYLAVGTLWSVINLACRVYKIKKTYLNTKQIFMDNEYHRTISTSPVVLPESEINLIVNKAWKISRENQIPSYREVMGNMASRLLFWPFSILQWLFGNMLKEISEYIVNKFKNLYRDVYEYILGDILNETRSEQK